MTEADRIFFINQFNLRDQSKEERQDEIKSQLKEIKGNISVITLQIQGIVKDSFIKCDNCPTRNTDVPALDNKIDTVVVSFAKISFWAENWKVGVGILSFMVGCILAPVLITFLTFYPQIKENANYIHSEKQKKVDKLTDAKEAVWQDEINSINK